MIKEVYISNSDSYSYNINKHVKAEPAILFFNGSYNVEYIIHIGFTLSW